MDGWKLDGWVGGWMGGKAGLRIAYSNQKKIERKRKIESKRKKKQKKTGIIPVSRLL